MSMTAARGGSAGNPAMAVAALCLVVGIIGIAFIVGKRMERELRKQDEQAAKEAAESSLRPRRTGPIVLDQAPSDLPGDPPSRTTALNMLNTANHGALIELLAEPGAVSRRAPDNGAVASNSAPRRIGQRPREAPKSAVAAQPALPARKSPRLNGGDGLSGGIGQPFDSTGDADAGGQ